MADHRLNVTAPLTRNGDAINEVNDKYVMRSLLEIDIYGSCISYGHGKIAFYSDVPQILHRLRATNVVIAACSRTAAPQLYVYLTLHASYPIIFVISSALEALSFLLIPPKASAQDASAIPAIEFFDQKRDIPWYGKSS